MIPLVIPATFFFLNVSEIEHSIFFDDDYMSYFIFYFELFGCLFLKQFCSPFILIKIATSLVIKLFALCFRPLQKLKVVFAVGTGGEVSEPLEVNALTCDTIQQVKEKILQTFQRKFGFPFQPIRDIEIGQWTPCFSLSHS